ncbi:MAG: transposase [Spiribacter salinus]|uniref:Transposase n=1 Tax=Spiribacter salinus TaxID=1335746 RepID=A0A540VPG5_9GAMM|nr:MAG: transposase [Spiribacter salinus]
MIAFPAGVKVWIAGGTTDKRRGMNTLALQVQRMRRLRPIDFADPVRSDFWEGFSI